MEFFRSSWGAHYECFSEACSYLLSLTVICCHLQLEISTFCLMVKGYLVFENEQIWAEAILQVVLEIFEKNNVTQPSQSSDAYTVHFGKKLTLQETLLASGFQFRCQKKSLNSCKYVSTPTNPFLCSKVELQRARPDQKQMKQMGFTRSH